MANQSIKNAFERMWQHVVDKFATKKEVEPYLSAMDYTPAVEKDILSERDIDFDTGFSLDFEVEDGTEFAEGKIYVVIYDGVEYRCSVRYHKYEFSDTVVPFIGNALEEVLGYSTLPDTGEPFCAHIGQGNQLVFGKRSSDIDQHRVRIYEYVEEKYTMDNLELITLDDIRAICVLFDPEIHADGTWVLSENQDDNGFPNYADEVILTFPNGFTSNGREFHSISLYIGVGYSIYFDWHSDNEVCVYDMEADEPLNSEYATIVIPSSTRWDNIEVTTDGYTDFEDPPEDMVAAIKAWFNTNATRV